MAYVSKKEISRTGGIDSEGYRHYVRSFLVETDDVLDGPKTVSAGVAIAHYSRYDCGGSEVDNQALCRTQDASLLSGEKYLLNYICAYDSKPFLQNTGPSGSAGDSLDPATPAAGQSPPSPNSQAPPDRPINIKFGSVHKSEVLYEDFTGWPLSSTAKPIRASNGEYLAGIEYDKSISQMVISAYSAVGNCYKVSFYKDRVNHLAFLGFPALQLKCTDYQIESVYEQGGWYFKRDITIQIDPDGWTKKVLDQGHFTKAPVGFSSSDSVKPTDIKGVVMNEPFLLDGSGGKLASGAKPVFLNFTPYKTRDFLDII